MSDIGEYQRGFEYGMLIGLRMAEAALKQGGSLVNVQSYVAELQDVRRRRAGDAKGCRDADYGDVFSGPIAHAADFGLPVSKTDEAVAAVSRMKILQKAEPRPSPEGVSGGEEVKSTDGEEQDAAQGIDAATAGKTPQAA